MGITERKQNIITEKTRYLFVFINALMKIWVYGYILKRNQLYLYVKPKNLIQVATGLKYNTITNMVSLLDIAVVDVPSRVLRRFEINYIFINYVYEYRLGLKIFTDGTYPIQSLNKLYKSSNWLEREAFDMFGIRFVFNYNLRRILTDYGFKGHPLRKDFPLIGYVDIYYDDSKHRVDVSFVETAQKLRFYNFENPWR